MKVEPEREAEFEAAWMNIAGHVSRAPGNLSQSLLRSYEDPSVFFVVSDWDSKESFERFERSDEQARLTAPLRALRVSAERAVHDLRAHVAAGQ
jgi:heme-degrading monooxygenase HmoA